MPVATYATGTPAAKADLLSATAVAKRSSPATRRAVLPVVKVQLAAVSTLPAESLMPEVNDAV
jgi:hypothetical protein